MSAGDRCEAFEPTSSAAKEERYKQNNAPALPFLSKFMLRNMDNSSSVWSLYETHLDEVQERIKMRNMYTQVLPLQDLDPSKGDAMWERQRDFLAKKARQEAMPRFGTLDYMVKQATTE